jgi:hypothetical protein
MCYTELMAQTVRIETVIERLRGSFVRLGAAAKTNRATESRVLLRGREASSRLGLILEEDAEVLVEQDVGVEHDRAHPHLPCAVRPPQQILTATGEELMIRLQVRAIHPKRGLGLCLAVFQRRLRPPLLDQAKCTGVARAGLKSVAGSQSPGVSPAQRRGRGARQKSQAPQRCGRS